MQKNWYIIYTKVKHEKKVASGVTKKKLECFIPMTTKELISGRKKKTVQKPLFESCLFVNMNESDIEKIKGIRGVVNLLYWKSDPAIVHSQDLEILKEFTSTYQDITVEKSRVNSNDTAKLIEGPLYSIDGNVLTVKNTTIKVNLPSMGFILVAKTDTATSLHPQIAFGKKDLLLQ